MMPHPSIFIGSSIKGKSIAQHIKAQLKDDAEVTIWHEGVFGLSLGTLESLVNKLDDFDFAILVLTPDDLIKSKGRVHQSARDNVLLECGLFIGRLGRERTFLVYDEDKKIKIPTDLAGINFATYNSNRQTLTEMAAIEDACYPIRNAVKKLGRRPKNIGIVDPVPEELSLSKLQDGINKVDANVQHIINILRNEKELPDSVYALRAKHYKEEKRRIAEHFVDQVLGPRIKYLKESSPKTKIRIIFDSGTTIAPILEVIGKNAEEDNHYWCKEIQVITNNIKGIENMLCYRAHRNDRYAPLSINQFSVLPGQVLAAFEAIADEETLKALEAYRDDGVYTIAVTTGNYILLHDRQFVEIARAGYHPDFKATLIDIAREVYVIAPLGKLLMWTGKATEGSGVNSVNAILTRLNKDLGFQPSPKHQFAADTEYNMVTRRLLSNPDGDSTGVESNDWLKKSVLVTTSRESYHLFYNHSVNVRAQFSHNLFRRDWEANKGPMIEMFPFSSLSGSPQQQLKAEIPHENFHSCAHHYFFFDDNFNVC